MPEPPKLDEADVLFELFLPMLCAQRHKALEHFKGKIELRMTAAEPRVWNLTGGRPPWILRGPVDSPDVVMTLSRSLVQRIVRGEDIDVESLAETGDFAVSGDVKMLGILEISLQEAQTLLGAMLSSKKQRPA